MSLTETPTYGDKRLVCKIAFASIGVVSGLSIFGIFLFMYCNYNAAMWGLVYAVLAIVLLHLYVSYRKNSLQRVYSIRSLNFMKSAGMFGSIAVVVASIAYIVLAAVEKQGYQVYGYGYAPAAVFSLMNTKWTSLLFFESRKYLRELKGDEIVKTLVSEIKTNPSICEAHSTTQQSTFN